MDHIFRVIFFQGNLRIRFILLGGPIDAPKNGDVFIEGDVGEMMGLYHAVKDGEEVDSKIKKKPPNSYIWWVVNGWTMNFKFSH